ncbi:MAG: PaaI family thioesterase [Comamonadaceae bacterium]|nr:MAG: PaaI family thioesterase [Comamonadaceae bacterium]
MTSLDFGAEIPFINHLGMTLELYEGGESVLGYVPAREHLNSFMVTHGGAVMTLMDVTMATAARSVQKDMGAVTIEMKTSFMRPAPGDGSKLTCKGRLIHRTATMAFTEGMLYDDKGQLCAHATGTFKYVKRLPIGPKGVNAMNAPNAPQAVGPISTD